jgi:hypothetical protein
MATAGALGEARMRALLVVMALAAVACGNGTGTGVSPGQSPTRASSPTPPQASTPQLPDLEPGRYRVTTPITREEATDAGLVSLDIDENMGTFTLTLDADGEMHLDQKGSAKAEFPHLKGAYEGDGNQIVLRVFYPFTGVWTMDFSRKGDLLSFEVVDVPKHEQRLPVEVIFETHPWRRLG